MGKANGWESADMRAWYVVKTKPRQEEQTSVVLQQRGIQVYLPQVLAPGAGRLLGQKGRLEALFPGYLFARLDHGSVEWVVARSAPGVAYFLGGEGIPTPVPESLVEAVRVRADTQQRMGWQTRFRAGERVVIAGGPLAGLEAVFEGRLSPTGRSRVFVDVVSRLVPVILSEELLRRAG